MEWTDVELGQLYDRYAHVIFHRCRTILRNEEEARDAVQETFARVVQNADQFRHQASPLTWMYRISTNYCLNQLRNRRGRERKHENHREEIGGASLVGPKAPEDLDYTRVVALLETMDEETQACVVHTFFDDCTREEVAALVGLSVPTVRKRIHTFLDRARAELGLAVAVLIAVISPWGTP